MPLDDRDYMRNIDVHDGKTKGAKYCTCVQCERARSERRKAKQQREGAVVKGFPERVFKPNTPTVTQQVVKKPPVWKRAIARLQSLFTSHKKA
jgi:hypothetical protein